MTELTYRYVALTDTGLRRPHNEDSGYASDRLLVIADGMGGAAAGELASSETMHVIRRLDQVAAGDVMAALEKAVADANERLAALIANDPAVEGMGTTLDAMAWDGEKLAFAHIGDSRVYRLRDHALTQISTDHTFVQSLIDEGRLTPEEARVHPHRSLILRAMLGRDDNDADLSWIQPMLGDRFLLCSDGLSDMVPDPLIEQALRAETIDLAATDLVRLALEAGGYDNVTVVIAEFVDKDTEPDELLSSANGQPQLVGAAASEPRPRTGKGSVESSSTTSKTYDPEELRYAPLPPSRRRLVRWVAGIVALLAIIGGIAYAAYDWSQKQYFVSAQGDQVTIYRGVQADIPGITLERIERVTTVSVSTLTPYQRQQVKAGIEASSRADADKVVERLSDSVASRTPTPTPTPSKTPTPKSTTSKAVFVR